MFDGEVSFILIYTGLYRVIYWVVPSYILGCTELYTSIYPVFVLWLVRVLIGQCAKWGCLIWSALLIVV
jgi:hypothetical protein